MLTNHQCTTVPNETRNAERIDLAQEIIFYRGGIGRCSLAEALDRAERQLDDLARFAAEWDARANAERWRWAATALYERQIALRHEYRTGGDELMHTWHNAQCQALAALFALVDGEEGGAA